MSMRSIILGALGAVFIATVGYFNYKVANLVRFGHSYFPVIVFFPVLLIAGAINPLLGRIRPTWRLRGAEIAVAAAIMLVACSISEAGLMRTWSRAVFMPPRLNETDVGWRKARVLSYVPSFMLTNEGVYVPQLFDDAFEGMRGQDESIGFREVPWSAWRRPLTFWMPLVTLFFAASICLSLIVHRQWSQHERLPYPIADFANSVMAPEAQGLGAIWRSRLFWVGAAVVFLLHLVNGIDAWTGGAFITIPRFFNFFEITQKFPSWGSVWGFGLMHVAIIPSIIAFACFINSDVSFSLGVSAVPFAFFNLGCYWAGVQFNWNYIDGGLLGWQMAGSFLATGLIVVYLGRRFYLLLGARCLGLGGGGEVRTYEAWAGRIFLLCMVALVVILNQIGLNWLFAIMTVALFMLGFLVFARVTVESGLFLTQTWWQPMAVMVSLFGYEALGLKSLAIIGLLCAVLTSDWRECLMPMVVNGLRICERNLVPAGRVGLGAGGAVLLVLAVGIPVGLWIDHNWGFNQGHGGAVHASQGALTYLAMGHDELRGEGTLQTSRELTTWQRITHAAPTTKFLWALIGGFVAVLLLTALRLKYTWWPLHPVLLLVWGTYMTQEVAYSFLLGWFIKRFAFRFGVSWRSLKTFMIGVVAGEMSAAAFWIIAGGAHYLATGMSPPKYHIFP